MPAHRPADPVLDPWFPRIVAALRRVGYDAAMVDPEDLATAVTGEIVYPYHSVVVRPDTNWADGVGNCLLDARLGSKAVLLLVRPSPDLVRAVAAAKKVVAGNVPPVDLWVLTESDATLDMGDGRVIPVA